jgi:hypothetical protein
LVHKSSEKTGCRFIAQGIYSAETTQAKSVHCQLKRVFEGLKSSPYHRRKPAINHSENESAGNFGSSELAVLEIAMAFFESGVGQKPARKGQKIGGYLGENVQ